MRNSPEMESSARRFHPPVNTCSNTSSSRARQLHDLALAPAKKRPVRMFVDVHDYSPHGLRQIYEFFTASNSIVNRIRHFSVSANRKQRRKITVGSREELAAIILIFLANHFQVLKHRAVCVCGVSIPCPALKHRSIATENANQPTF